PVSRGQYIAEDGHDRSVGFALAETDLNQALERDPATGDAPLGRAQGRLYRAAYQMPPGADPLGDYTQAEKDLDELVRRPPHSQTWQAWHMKGDTLFLRGRYLGTRGRDPGADFGRAKTALLKALEISRSDQESAGTRAGLGQL